MRLPDVVHRIAEANAARYHLHPDGRAPMGGPEAVFQLLREEMSCLPQEQLRVLLLDTRNRLTDVILVYQGTVDTQVVRPAEVLRPAVVVNAPAIIVVHNHPSGDPTPSPQDVALTKTLKAAADVMDIELVDHVVIGFERWASLSDLGHLKRLTRIAARRRIGASGLV